MALLFRYTIELHGELTEVETARLDEQLFFGGPAERSPRSRRTEGRRDVLHRPRPVRRHRQGPAMNQHEV
jgi:hypothetical protein